jgi:hypothetical protein
MYIGILYQQNINKGIQYQKFLYVHRKTVQENIDIGIQYQKRNCLGLYSVHHFTEFLQHEM